MCSVIFCTLRISCICYFLNLKLSKTILFYESAPNIWGFHIKKCTIKDLTLMSIVNSLDKNKIIQGSALSMVFNGIS